MSQRIYYSEEARQRAQAQRSMLALIFLALGIGLGAALALLFAPISGEKFRHTVAENANDAMEDANRGLKKLIG